MKTQHVIGVIIAVAAAAVAIDRYYQHPTFGRGLNAFAAAFQAGALLA